MKTASRFQVKLKDRILAPAIPVLERNMASPPAFTREQLAMVRKWKDSNLAGYSEWPIPSFIFDMFDKLLHPEAYIVLAERILLGTANTPSNLYESWVDRFESAGQWLYEGRSKIFTVEQLLLSNFYLMVVLVFSFYPGKYSLPRCWFPFGTKHIEPDSAWKQDAANGFLKEFVDTFKHFNQGPIHVDWDFSPMRDFLASYVQEQANRNIFADLMGFMLGTKPIDALEQLRFEKLETGFIPVYKKHAKEEAERSLQESLEWD